MLAADPELERGLASLPSQAAIDTTRPTPSTSIDSNGLTVKMPSSMYCGKNAASTSSRLKPHTVCVMSFVPKEKKSASVAISAAVIAARGSSIIVPIMNSSAHAGLRRDPGDGPLRLVTHHRQLLHGRDERHHDLRLRVVAGLDRAGGRLGDRLHLQHEQLGHDEPEADAAGAEHRVLLVHAAAPGRSSVLGLVVGSAGRLGDGDLAPRAR